MPIDSVIEHERIWMDGLNRRYAVDIKDPTIVVQQGKAGAAPKAAPAAPPIAPAAPAPPVPATPAVAAASQPVVDATATADDVVETA